MKSEHVLDALGEVRDKYIVEAAPTKKVKRCQGLIRWGTVAACVCLLMAGVLQFNQSSTTNPPSFSLVMTAYAADGTGYKIGNTPVVITDNMEVSSGFSARYDEGNGHGRENFLFRVICENREIESVSYTIAGEENAQSLVDMKNNKAWFATQELTKNQVEHTFPVYASRRSSAGTYAYTYIGNNYTTTYDEQDVSEMFLEYWIKEKAGQWFAEEININVNITLKDGSTIEKELLIHPSYDNNERNLHISLK